MDALLRVETLAVIFLLIAAFVAVVGRRVRVPYTVALVLAGLVLSLTSRQKLNLAPDIILSLFIPPLVFEAAFHLNLDELRRNLGMVALLAVPGVILTMALVGSVLALGAGIPWPVAMVFGALVSATDPVAVVAIFRKLGAPKQLSVLLEGESLLNDGTAIVVFKLALVVILTAKFQLVDGLVGFLRVAGGGVLTGLVLGWLVSLVIARIDEHLVETTLTTILAFGSYLLAERVLGVSGVLAVVAAGLVNGNASPKGMSPTTRIVVFNFWEYIAFLANSAVFLLIGLQVNLPQLLANWQTVLWAIGAVLASRALMVYGLSRLGGRMPTSWRHVLFWGGLRGAICLALALSLPAAMGPERERVVAMAFGVVLFTLLAQGLSMNWLLKRLRIFSRSEEQIQYEMRHARAMAARAGFVHARKLHEAGLISSPTWQSLRPILQARLKALAGAVQSVLKEAPELEREELSAARRETLRASRAKLASMRRDDLISDEVYEELVTEVDAAMETGTEAWAAHMMSNPSVSSITQLMMVIVQDRDLEAASHALAESGIAATNIQSKGGFLRQRNHVLLIGMAKDRLPAAVQALQRSCSSRVEYLPGPMPDLGFPMPPAVPVEVHGATVFVFEIERAEVI